MSVGGGSPSVPIGAHWGKIWLHGVSRGIMENKMATTIMGYRGFRVENLPKRNLFKHAHTIDKHQSKCYTLRAGVEGLHSSNG